MLDPKVLMEAARLLREKGWEAGLAWSAGGAEIVVKVDGRYAIMKAKAMKSGLSVKTLVKEVEKLLGDVN